LYHKYLIKENAKFSNIRGGLFKLRKRKLTDFGELVKLRLFQLNMTQKNLAARVGTSEEYLSMILYGERSGKKYKDKIKSVLFDGNEELNQKQKK